MPGNTTITQSIKVLFTVSGTGIAGTSNVTEETTEPSTEPILATEETTEPATGGVEPTPTDPTDAAETEPTTNVPATSANTQVTTVAANANNNSNNGGNTTGEIRCQTVRQDHRRQRAPVLRLLLQVLLLRQVPLC